MSRNTQMFALRDPPPVKIDVGGCEYRLVRAFKHDFWAATCLYETDAEKRFPKIVVKFGRTQPFCGLGLSFLGRWLRDHEEGIYRTLNGIEGVPHWVGCVGETGLAVEYIDAVPLDHLEAPPAGFFERLRELFDRIHHRGVGYCDANKRSNILVSPGGLPFLVDYQLAIRRRDELPFPLRNLIRAIVKRISAKDLYHLYKHKRRLSPDELTDEEDADTPKAHKTVSQPPQEVPTAPIRQRCIAQPDRRARRPPPTGKTDLAKGKINPDNSFGMNCHESHGP
ncbi:MAG: protein kinase family protein [Planctomycetota bacterium]|jgi:hypothetical protein